MKISPEIDAVLERMRTEGRSLALDHELSHALRCHKPADGINLQQVIHLHNVLCDQEKGD